MRVALAENLSGIDSVELGHQPDPAPAAGQALIRVYGAGLGPRDIGFLSSGFPGIALPFVPGQEVAGVVDAVGDGAGVRPGERVGMGDPVHPDASRIQWLSPGWRVVHLRHRMQWGRVVRDSASQTVGTTLAERYS